MKDRQYRRLRGTAAAATVAACALAGLGVPATAAPPSGEVRQVEDLAYGPADPGNLLDLYLPATRGKSELPLIVWHSGSAFLSNRTKDAAQSVAIAEEFTVRGYAVATVNYRASSEARFPEQGYDVRAAVRYLRENARTYGIDPDRFAVMGNSSGGWAAAFTATTSDTLELPGETGVDGTSSAVQAAVPFFAPTDFLSMDAFAAANDLPMGFAYPHDSPTSPEGLLIECPGEVYPALLVSIQECPEQTEAADPSSYIDGEEVPMWVLHGLEDVLLPYNQSQLVYETTTGEGNEARLTLVPSAGHNVDEIIDAPEATTWVTNRGGKERVVEGSGPSWDEIDRFLHRSLSRAR